MPRDEDVDIPSLTLDHDEVSERRTGAATGSVSKRRLNPPPARPSNTSSSTVYKKPSLLGVYILLVFILAACSGAGFWLWQQNAQLRNELFGAKNEIENLDHQLLASDVSANKQGETVEETLKNHDSEIRKLWGVSYDKNRKAISENANSIEDLEKKMSAVREASSTQSKRIAIQSDAFSELEDGYHKLVKSAASIDENVKSLADQIVNLNQQQANNQAKLESMKKELSSQAGKDEAQALSLDQLSQDLDALQKKVSGLENKPAGPSSSELSNVEQTLSKHQEAIDSNDEFRSQINAEIIRLRKQLNQVMLQQQLNSEN